MKLTEKAVAQLALPEGITDRIWFDDDLPGFGLRIRSGGKRTWVVQYKHGDKQRRMTLGTVDVASRGGKHGSLNLATARKTAKDMLASVHLGNDPHRARRSKPAAMPAGRWLQSSQTTFPT